MARVRTSRRDLTRANVAKVCLVLTALLVQGCGFFETVFPADLRGRQPVLQFDTDQDGISDIAERNNGLNPLDPDSDKNGVLDSYDDYDKDGLANIWEISFGFDPFNADSASSKYGAERAGNSVSDCDEDIDGDGAGICWEFQYGFDPTNNDDLTKDADGDGFSNAEEFGKLCAFLCSAHSGYIVGQNILIDGGRYRGNF